MVSMAPAAPRQWPIIDLVALIQGKSAASTAKGGGPVRDFMGIGKGGREVAVDGIHIGRVIPASRIASRMQRRTPSGLGAVMVPPPHWPPALT
jgi:hypothetical protein